MNVAKVEKKEKPSTDKNVTRKFKLNEKEGQKTSSTSYYSSNNKIDEFSSNLSPSTIERIDNKEIPSIEIVNNNENARQHISNEIVEIVEIKPKIEEKIDLAVSIERRNNCLQTTIERFLNKFEIANLLSLNKKISKVAVTHLIKIFKQDILNYEDKVKILKEVN